MAYTENDIKENIDSGNIYIQPNTRGTLSYINEYRRIGTMDFYNITQGTLSIDVKLESVTSNSYMRFKDGSYIRIELNPTWSTGTIPIVTVISFNAYFGLYDDATETVTEYLISSATGMTGYKETWTFDLIQGVWVANENILYQVGDIFTYNMTWWDIAVPKFRYTFYATTAGAGAYSVTPWYDVLNPNIMSNGSGGGYQLNTTVGQIFAEFMSGNKTEGTQYPGDDSTTGGGDGAFYQEDFAIPRSNFPVTQPIDWGFNTIYSPSDADMRAIARWMWSDDYTDAIKMNLISPIENILTLAMTPIDLSNYKAISTLVIGNVDSAIQTNKINSQYISINCGTVSIDEYWQSFLDYDTQFNLWLPFVGFRSIRPDDLLGHELGVEYKVDLLTGNATAEVYNNSEDNEHVLYNYSCNVYYNCALSGANYMAMYNQQLSATVSGINNLVNSVGQIASGNILNGITSLFTGQATAKREYETAKPDYGRGGNNSGNAGLFSVRYPYLIIYRPIGQTPRNYKSLHGIPSQIYSILSELSGYTEIDKVIVDTLVHCTAEEKTSILAMLSSGVYL